MDGETNDHYGQSINHAADNISKFHDLQKVKLFHFHHHIFNPCEICIQISTNMPGIYIYSMPSIVLLFCEKGFEIGFFFRKQKHFE